MFDEIRNKFSYMIYLESGLMLKELKTDKENLIVYESYLDPEFKNRIGELSINILDDIVFIKVDVSDKISDNLQSVRIILDTLKDYFKTYYIKLKKIPGLPFYCEMMGYELVSDKDKNWYIIKLEDGICIC